MIETDAPPRAAEEETDTRIVLRPARPSDARQAALLLYEAIGHQVATAVWGLGRADRALKQLEQLFAWPGGLQSYDIATCAAADGQVIGLISHASWRTIASRERATRRSYARAYGPLATWRLNRRLRHLVRVSPPVDSDDWFIAYSAVLPEYRGIGIGTTLVDAAHTAALETAAPAVSAYVSIENRRAYAFFRRCGYVEHGRLASADLARLTGVSGRVRMTRPLDDLRPA